MLRYIVITAVCCLLLLPATSFATVIHVPSQEPTIQAGINAAAVGDTVILASGLYYGPGNRDIDFLGKDITVRSHDNNPGTCTVFCQGTPADPHRGFIFQSGESSLARLEGITISEGYLSGYGDLEENGGGIICLSGSSPTIRNCRITQCETTGCGAGFFSRNSAPTLIDCKIDNNHSGQCGGGVAVDGPDPFVMIGCLITDNECGNGYDGLLINSPSSIIYECTFANHRNTAVYAELPTTLSNCTIVDNGIAVRSVYNVVIENTLIAFNETAVYDIGISRYNITCSNIFGNDDGDWVATVEHLAGINGNISADPLLCDPGNWDYSVAANSPCLSDLCGTIGAVGVGQCGTPSSVLATPELSFQLRGCYPNPFNPSTTISYVLGRDSAVQLQVFDVAGKLVRTLVDETSVAAGPHDVRWHGRDDDGQNVAAGVFLYVLTTPDGRDTGRMALIK